MQLISNKRLHFRKESVTADKQSGELFSKVEDEIIVAAISQPQIVPDWVKSTDLFKLSVDDGSVIEVVLKKNAKPEQTLKGLDTAPKFQNATTPVAQVAGSETPQQVQQSGWGAAPNGMQN